MDVRIHDLLTRLATVSPQRIGATLGDDARTFAQLDAGVHAIGKKIVEEAAEVWMAAEYEGTENTAMEISQLLYHVQVMMIATGLTTADVYRNL